MKLRSEDLTHRDKHEFWKYTRRSRVVGGRKVARREFWFPKSHSANSKYSKFTDWFGNVWPACGSTPTSNGGGIIRCK